MKRRIVLTILLVVILVMALSASAFAKGGSSTKTYRGSLVELNGSGVTGQVWITKLPGQLKVTISAYGLVPRKPHMQHIHGFMDGAQAVVPPMAADTNGDGFVSLAESVVYTGPVLLELKPYPTARKGGRIEFTWVYRGAALEKLSLDSVPLNRRVVMLHGGYWSSAYGMWEYDELLPVAACRIIGPAAK